MHPEAEAGLNSVVVHDAQSAKSHMCGIIEVTKRKRMVSVEPTVVEMTAFRCLAYPNHVCLLSSCDSVNYIRKSFICQVNSHERTGGSAGSREFSAFAVAVSRPGLVRTCFPR